ncbi:flagellar motor stator protein MotA [Halomonas denitrificans]|uniref:flagellar motor stator protein MotA n=1 Tax=Halomonas TaxID=2745 RepID=UPI001A8ECD0F|nr:MULTISPECIES: flagellar motor stator protein MotA [Halomonas]MBN8412630.1 flagellar motor stator protein MotA [Halomonas litopenaei]MED5296143.1 flagellar motor stator protein MotA [Pseudomonadota bacterium]MBY5924942.1 flagellar motor stator protein MotA [Halomonas sp. DP4Y7-2]MBY5928721.1 flagellar motor stator protein MotA [Halomonas sp. DP8Y7-3]MBY5967893.1 flagellar motor stator protein MotA [Halomonas denitrificans]
MLIPIGFAVVLLSVFGGFVLSGGSLGPLFQPTELLMIGGAGLGAFIASNHGKALKATFRIFPRLKRSKRYDKAMYMELMALLYRILAKVRRDGMLGIERDIDNPAESALFSEYPKVLADPMIMNFLTDYLRLMVAGSMDPMEIDELMLHEIEMFEQEAHIPADAIAKVGDAMPAFGIVAAVMGVVKALSASAADPSEMGVMIAHALVGTFLGILLGYGFISPLASRIERQTGESVKMLQCLRVTMLASLHGYPPQLAVEFGRKALHTSERPSFKELEDHVRDAKAGAGAA